MALLAVRLVPVGMVLSSRIDAGGDGFEVVGVDAVPLPTQVIELHPLGYGLVVVMLPEDSVDDSLGVAGSPLCEGVSVAVEGALPEPAAVLVDEDLALESGELCSVESVVWVGHGVMLHPDV